MRTIRTVPRARLDQVPGDRGTAVREEATAGGDTRQRDGVDRGPAPPVAAASDHEAPAEAGVRPGDVVCIPALAAALRKAFAPTHRDG